MEGIGESGFWIFLSVVWYCDHKMYLEGHNTWFFRHKTKEEQQIRKNKIEANDE